mmetsp:Transcript_30641/g.79572  ORF Transcript_30641/g.79572 Transcript_30641/m.79572 type:complete len:233 (+) Transcript_30641:237-935(+)
MGACRAYVRALLLMQVTHSRHIGLSARDHRSTEYRSQSNGGGRCALVVLAETLVLQNVFPFLFRFSFQFRLEILVAISTAIVVQEAWAHWVGVRICPFHGSGRYGRRHTPLSLVGALILRSRWVPFEGEWYPWHTIPYICLAQIVDHKYCVSLPSLSSVAIRTAYAQAPRWIGLSLLDHLTYDRRWIRLDGCAATNAIRWIVDSSCLEASALAVALVTSADFILLRHVTQGR